MNSHSEQFKISSSQDIFEKLKFFSDEEKNKIIIMINDFIKSHNVRTPLIRIHSQDVANLVESRNLSTGLARHLVDIFIVDYSAEDLKDNFLLKKIFLIVLPRLTERGLVIFKDESGVRVWKKNVRYGLKSQLLEVTY